MAELGSRLDALVPTPAESTIPGMMLLATLFTMPRTDPRTDPGKRPGFTRQLGPYHLRMGVTDEDDLPHGALSRLAFAWVIAEAVRTQCPILDVRHSIDAFMRRINVEEPNDLEDQLRRLFSVVIRLRYHNGACECVHLALIADTLVFCWPTVEARRTGRECMDWVRLGDRLFEDILSLAAPLDMDVLRAMRRSALGLDLYLWLAYWLSWSAAPLQLTWAQLNLVLGDPAREDENAIDDLRADVLRELLKLRDVWPKFDYRSSSGGLELHRPVIAPAPQVFAPAPQVS